MNSPIARLIIALIPLFVGFLIGSSVSTVLAILFFGLGIAGFLALGGVQAFRDTFLTLK